MLEVYYKFHGVGKGLYIRLCYKYHKDQNNSCNKYEENLLH